MKKKNVTKLVIGVCALVLSFTMLVGCGDKNVEDTKKENKTENAGKSKTENKKGGLLGGLFGSKNNEEVIDNTDESKTGDNDLNESIDELENNGEVIDNTNESKTGDNDLNESINELENNGENVLGGTGFDNSEIYIDDNRMSYKMDDTYEIVYYHDGTNITGLEYIYELDTVEEATASEIEIKADITADDNVDKVVRDGKKITVTFNKKEFEDDDVETIKAGFMLLQALNNQASE